MVIHTNILYIYICTSLYIYVHNTSIHYYIYIYVCVCVVHLHIWSSPSIVAPQHAWGSKKIFKGSTKNIIFSCAGAVFWPFYAIFKSCGLWISRSSSPLPWSPGPLVLWSLGALVPWSFGPLVPWSLDPLVFWSSGPLVLLSSGPLVLPSFGDSSALKHFEDNP